MRVNSSTYFNIDEFHPKGQTYDVSFGELCIQFSEEASLQSDPQNPREFTMKHLSALRHPVQVISVILALSYLRTGWSSAEESEFLLRHCYNMARNCRFEGKWKFVGEILQQDLFTFGISGILTRICNNCSEEDFFGNILPLTYNLIKEREICFRSMYKPYREVTGKDRFKGIKRKIRRRGYNDKGSSKPESSKYPKELEVQKDVWLIEKEYRRIEEENKFPQLRLPPSIYWYQSHYGVGPDSSIR